MKINHPSADGDAGIHPKPYNSLGKRDVPAKRTFQLQLLKIELNIANSSADGDAGIHPKPYNSLGKRDVPAKHNISTAFQHEFALILPYFNENHGISTKPYNSLLFVTFSSPFRHFSSPFHNLFVAPLGAKIPL